MPLKINTNYLNNTGISFTIAHQADSLMDMKRIISLYGPTLILDFGTYSGGTVAVFHDACPYAEIHTYDNNQRKVEPIKIKNDRIHYHIEDILNTQSEELVNFLKSKEKKFIYCDNGNKPKEMNTFVPLLNSGDLIGVHDWNKEINNKDISELLDILSPVEHEWFEGNNWLTRFWIKK